MKSSNYNMIVFFFDFVLLILISPVLNVIIFVPVSNKFEFCFIFVFSRLLSLFFDFLQYFCKFALLLCSNTSFLIYLLHSLYTGSSFARLCCFVCFFSPIYKIHQRKSARVSLSLTILICNTNRNNTTRSNLSKYYQTNDKATHKDKYTY